MDFFIFNRDHGYLEGLIRGLNNSLMTRTDYGNLAQAENLEELKISLQATHYQKQLMNLCEKMTISQLEDILQERYYKEFQYIRTNAIEPLSSFLDYLTYGYMIDNIALLISGILHGRPLSELLLRCHPLGKFEHISAISVCSSPAELYNAILVDTPLAKFFGACVSEQDFDETHVVIIRNYVYREYLECFNKFIKSIGGVTEAMMRPILQFESDRRAFIITMNSLGTDLNKEDRLKFFNTFGLLDQSSLIKLAKADDFDQIKQIASGFSQYAGIFASIDFQNQTKSIEDGFFEQEVKLHNSTFEFQFSFAVFYSYFRLMEQQIRNIIWVAECISQKNKSRIDQYLKVFP